MRPWLCTLIILILYVDGLQANEPPQVSNVRAVQRADTTLVDITYDLADADGDTLFVTVSILDSAGVDTVREAVTFSGDLGADILSGSGKRIVWNVGRDLPNTFRKYVALVTANDGPGVPGGDLTPQPGGNEIVVTTPAATQHVMVLVPEGEFQMGSEAGSSDERPVHTVFLDTYYIDKYGVTHAQWNAYAKATQKSTKSGLDDHPVAFVTWFDADGYCQWIGGRLPIEAEWEKAARGTDGRTYPWGNDWDNRRANAWNSGDPFDNGTTPVGYYDGSNRNGYQTQAGQSPYGAHDMVGNVWEWCADWYNGGYYAQSPSRNPTGPLSGSFRVLRGGSWYLSGNDVRAADRGRGTPSNAGNSYGFRCVVRP